jgi:ApaG protein
MTRPFFYRETEGMRVTVRPAFLRDRSRPEQREYVFIYYVRLENVSGRAAQLLSRRWLIHDSVGEDTAVEGDGVVGEQPHIGPGDVFQYHSFCMLKSPRGHMVGQYRFVRPDGSRFEAQIPRFELDAGVEGLSAP